MEASSFPGFHPTAINEIRKVHTVNTGCWRLEVGGTQAFYYLRGSMSPARGHLWVSKGASIGYGGLDLWTAVKDRNELWNNTGSVLVPSKLQRRDSKR